MTKKRRYRLVGGLCLLVCLVCVTVLLFHSCSSTPEKPEGGRSDVSAVSSEPSGAETESSSPSESGSQADVTSDPEPVRTNIPDGIRPCRQSTTRSCRTRTMTAST